VHIYTQTIHRTTHPTQTVHRTTQLTNWEECGPCPVFASYTLVFVLQLRKKSQKNLSQGSQKVPIGMMKTEYTEKKKQNIPYTIKVTGYMVVRGGSSQQELFHTKIRTFLRL